VQIYISARRHPKDLEEAVAAAQVFREAGFQDIIVPVEARREANLRTELSKADVVVVVNPPGRDNCEPGREVWLEVGFALAKEKRVVVVGTTHSLPALADNALVTECDNYEEAASYILAFPRPARAEKDVDAYQEWTRKTAKYPARGTPTFQAIGYCTLGDVGESAETYEKILVFIETRMSELGIQHTQASTRLVEILKRAIDVGKPAEVLKREIRSGALTLPDFGPVIPEAFLAMLELESGDRVWYIARELDDLGIKLSRVLGRNQEKLESRLSRGVIHGNGDNR
jgi:hypothetical protein